MKKIILALVVLAIALPASAVEPEVLITCAQVGEEPNVIVSYVNTYGEPVRAFALEIILDAGEIVAVSCLSDDYYVFPGSIVINDGVPGPWGSCAASIDANVAIIEMGSLYAAEDACHPAAPPDEGDLLLVTVSEGCQMSIIENSLRGGVVMETPEAEPDVNAPGCEVDIGCECWGDISGPTPGVPDNMVSTSDLSHMLVLLGAAGPPYQVCPVPPGYECMDISGPTVGQQDGCITTSDLSALLVYFGGLGAPYQGPCMPAPAPAP